MEFIVNSVIFTLLSHLILCCVLMVRITTAGSISNSLELSRQAGGGRPHSDSISNDLDYVWLDSGDEDSNEGRRRGPARKARLRYNSNYVPEVGTARRSRSRANAMSDTIIIQAEPDFNTDISMGGVLNFHQRRITRADPSVRVKQAMVCVQFQTNDDPTSVKKRHRKNKKEVKLYPVLLRTVGGKRTIASWGKPWGGPEVTVPHEDINRTEKPAKNVVVRRFRFNVKQMGSEVAPGKGQAAPYFDNFTENFLVNSDLPRLVSWRMPANVELTVVCRIRRKTVDCAKHGVSMYSLPSLVVTTARVRPN